MSCRKDCLNCDAENVKTGTCGYCHADLCEECCREDFEDADSCCSNDAFDWCCKDCEEMNGVDDRDAPNTYPYKKCCDCEERKSCGSYKDDKWFCEDCYEEEPKPTAVVTGRKFILKIKNGKVVSKTQI
jgi:hypothetical protein